MVVKLVKKLKEYIDAKIYEQIYTHESWYHNVSTQTSNPDDIWEKVEEIAVLEEVKACPFCSSKDTITLRGQKEGDKLFWWFECWNPHCRIQPASQMREDREVAIEWWNQRIFEPN